MSLRLPSLTALALLAAAALPAEALALSGPERVACTRAIEEVYWQDRIWPADNLAPKPPLSALLDEPSLIAQAEDGPRMSQALEWRYGVVLDAARVEAELARMAQQSQAPAQLGRLFAALGDDASTVAECLVRPVLARRLLAQHYAFDRREHGTIEALALAAQGKAAGAAPRGTTVTRLTLERESDARSKAPAGPGTQCLDHEAFEQAIAAPAFSEDAEGWTMRHVLAQDARRLELEVWRFEKRPFETWWAAERAGFDGRVPALQLSGDLPTPGVGSPNGNTKATLADGWRVQAVPEARSNHIQIWTGSELLVWGGYDAGDTLLRSGGRYRPATGAWLPMSELNAPSPRRGAGVAWTGQRLLIWGGESPSFANLGDGAMYDPVSDTWQPMSASGAPVARSWLAMVWSGSRAIVWGGRASSGLTSGARFDPVGNTWEAMSNVNTPDPGMVTSAIWGGGYMNVFSNGADARYDPVADLWLPIAFDYSPFHSFAWTGTDVLILSRIGASLGGFRYNPVGNSQQTISQTGAPTVHLGLATAWDGSGLLVWGGSDTGGPPAAPGGARYNPVANQWTPIAATGAPSPRRYAGAAWTGSEMIIWGGRDDSNGALRNGGRYNPATNQWQGLAGNNLPTARSGHSAVWTGSEMIVWGGQGTAGYLGDGARYRPATDDWLVTSANGEPPPRRAHSAVWTGTTMIVWGGADASQYVVDGGRYNPATDTWANVGNTGAPAPRTDHTAVWTGTEMIVWGGYDGLTRNTGARYNPALNSWTTTSMSMVPPPADRHTAVWTGSRMLVWGGFGETSLNQSGGSYDPSGNAWTLLPTTNAPSARMQHSAVWTGSDMLVWGGNAGGVVANGAAYRPATGLWQALPGTGAPSARDRHSAVWSGSEMLVWGGQGTALRGDGARFNPASQSWQALSNVEAPSARRQHTAVWTGDSMLVWGGSNGVGPLDSLGIYRLDAIPPGQIFGNGFE